MVPIWKPLSRPPMLSPGPMGALCWRLRAAARACRARHAQRVARQASLVGRKLMAFISIRPRLHLESVLGREHQQSQVIELASACECADKISMGTGLGPSKPMRSALNIRVAPEPRAECQLLANLVGC